MMTSVALFPKMQVLLVWLVVGCCCCAHAVALVGCMALVGWLVGWLVVGWLVGWLVVGWWLVGWWSNGQ